MALTYKNPGVTNAEKLAKTGRIALFRKTGDTELVDFGWLPSAEPKNDESKTDVKGNREGGPDAVITSILDSVSYGFDFASLSSTDVEVLRAHMGSSTALTGDLVGGYVAANGQDAKLTGAFALVEKAGDASKLSVITFHPSATIAPNGRGTDQNLTTLQFSERAVQDVDYVLPAELAGAPATVMSYGATIVVPTSKVSAVLDALFA